MQLLKLSGSIALLMTLSCCSTTTSKTTHPGSGSDNLPYDCHDGKCTDADVQPAYNKNSMTCVNMQNHYELNGNNKKVTTLVIAAVGALAGAVFAPLSKGSGTKAWSGLAGTTSAFQGQLEEQYSNLAFEEQRGQV